MPLEPGDLDDVAGAPTSPDDFDDSNADFGDDLVDAPADDTTTDAPAEETGSDAAQAAEHGDDAGSADGDESSQGDGDPVDGASADAAQAQEPFVPKSRMDRALARARQAEEALEQYRAQAADAPGAPRDFDAESAALQEKFTQALLDNSPEEATKITAQLMALSQEQIREEMTRSYDDSIIAAQDKVEYNNMLADLEASFPELNADEGNDQFDQDLVDDIDGMREYYYNQGLSQSEALAKAVKIRFPQAYQKTQDAPTGGTKNRGLKEKLAKAADAAPGLAGVGQDAPALGQAQQLDANKMTREDWFNLPDDDPRWNDLLGNDF